MESPTPTGQAPAPAGSAAALDCLDHAHQELVAAEVAELIAIAQVAELWQVDQTAVIDGMERLLQLGHDGTPLVGEFCALEIGPLLGISPTSAIIRIGQALDLRHRFPILWDAVLSGRVRVWQAMQVVTQTGHLGQHAAAELDATVAHGLTTMPWPRITAALPGWIMAADPTLAAEQATLAAEARHVRVAEVQDGQVQFWGRVAPSDGISFDHALTEIAKTLPVTNPDQPGRDLDQRRAAAVGILAQQAFGQDGLPTHTLIIHINADDPALDQDHGQARAASSSGVARVEKWGPILTQSLPQFLANSRVIVRPVLDAAAIIPVDAYETPAQMGLALQLRNPVDVFPYGVRPASSCDLDHTLAYADGPAGQTRLDNLGPLSRFTHRGKTHGRWRLTQPEPGTYHWTSPHGYQYLVTAAGTTKITPPATAA